jgi:L-iditol 2-dehydrogenase
MPVWAYQLQAPCSLDRVEVSAPDGAALRPGQALLRMLVGGICGSDLAVFAGTRLLSSTTIDGGTQTGAGCPMHEVVGEVLVSTDPDLRVGSRVVGWASGRNGLAEFVVCDGAGLYEFSAEFTPQVAIMLQPLACVIYAVDQMSHLEGRSAAVIGQGPIGLLFSHVLKSRGARHVTGVDRVDRSWAATRFGVDEAVRTSSGLWALALPPDDRPEVVVEAVGHQVSTLNDAVQAVADEGEIFYFGIPDDQVYPFAMYQFLRKNARLIAGTTRRRREALASAEDYLKMYPQLPASYLTNTYPVTEAQTAFEVASRPTAHRLKVTVQMT